LQDVGALVIHAALLSTLVSATVGVICGWWGGLIPTAQFGQAWWTWWLGDLLADLLVAPLVLLWSRPPPLRLTYRTVAELLAGLIALGGICLLVFANLRGFSSTGASYLFFPLLIWTALRYGPPGAALASAVVSLVMIWGTAQGWGPFVRDTLRESLLLVQAFMGIAAMTSLLLAAMVAERRRAEAQQVHFYQEAQEARATAEESLALLETLLSTAPVGLAFMDQELRYRHINAALAAINGLPPAAPLGRASHEIIPDLAPQLELLHRQVLETGKPILNVEIYAQNHSAPGEQSSWLSSSYPVRLHDGRLLGVGVVAIDITERKRMEADLKAALHETELLLREVHHRVKNNLQVVSSLLGLQAHAIQDNRLRAYFEESRDRIHAMALIHEHLCQSSTLGHIEMADYIQELATSVVRSYCLGQDRISLEICAEALSFNLETAIPCGLLLHELLSNGVKHAFPDGRSGTIRVSLRRQSSQAYVLTVQDNGVGLPLGFDVHASPSLGWQLVQLLATQLRATLTCQSHEGTTVTCIFAQRPSQVSSAADAPWDREPATKDGYPDRHGV
jgi:PAS domain S-box-containing protein